MKNFHLPLPEQTYNQLREQAERAGAPATILARQAIDCWLRNSCGRRDTMRSPRTLRKRQERTSTSTRNWSRPESSI